MTLSILDQQDSFDDRRFSRLSELLSGLPAQAREAWSTAQSFPLPDEFRHPSDVAMFGMGGSAIGGDVIATIAAQTRAVPIQVIRNYIPPATRDRSLLIAASFSGDTEETIEAFERSFSAGGHRLAVTTGGRLAQLADERGVPTFRFAWAGPPRTALGYAVFAPLALLHRLDAIELRAGEVERTLDAIEVSTSRWSPEMPSESNEAKRIAQRLAGRLPIVVGSDFLDVAARRWATDINENAKQWALPLALPELNHNQLEGLAAPAEVRGHLTVVLLSAPSTHARNALRVDLTADALRNAQVDYVRADVGGTTPLAAVMEACILGSWTSLYLAVLNQVDPIPTPTMDALKARLAATR